MGLVIEVCLWVKHFTLCRQLYKFALEGCSAQESVSLINETVAV